MEAGSHQGEPSSIQHESKSGTVTVAGHASIDIPPGHFEQHPGRCEMKYLVVYEKSSNGWGAYTPDLPGLGVVGPTLDETKQLIREAIEFHLEGMRQHGESIPVPSSETEYITV